MIQLIQTDAPKSILDIGINVEKHGLILRQIYELPSQKYNRDKWNLKIDSLDLCQSLQSPIQAHVYDDSYLSNFVEIFENIDKLPQYDNTILGETIQYYEKREGIKLISKLLKHTHHSVFVTIPVTPHSPIEETGIDPATITIWTPSDFSTLNFSYTKVGKPNSEIYIFRFWEEHLNCELADIKVSIIIPTFNVAKYIKVTLDSLVNQDIGNYEIIVVDDGSEDETYEILKTYSHLFEFIEVTQIKHSRGPGEARNIGLQKARGKYIYFVDGDDFIPNNALKTLYYLAENNNADISIGRMFFKEESQYKKLCKMDRIYSNKIITNQNITKNPALKYLLGPTSKLYKKTFLIKINFSFPQGTFYEDFPVIHLSYYLTDKVVITPDFVYGCRIRNDRDIASITQTINQDESKRDYTKMKELEEKLLTENNIKKSTLQEEFELQMSQEEGELINKGLPSVYVYTELSLDALPKSCNLFE